MRELTERITFQTDQPVAISVATLSRTGTTAVATTAVPHGFNNGDFVDIAGAVPAAYNGEFQIALIDALTFHYQVTDNPPTPATGTIIATFKSDAQGGQGVGWRPFVTVSAKVEALSAGERLQAEAIQSTVAYRAEIQYRADISPKMRVVWVPFRATTAKTLEIHGVLPHRDFPRERVIVECGELVQ